MGGLVDMDTLKHLFRQGCSYGHIVYHCVLFWSWTFLEGVFLFRFLLWFAIVQVSHLIDPDVFLVISCFVKP